MNLYGYGFGDPVNGADRSGLLKDQCEGMGPDECSRFSSDPMMSTGMGVFLNAVSAPGGGIPGFSPALAGAVAEWEEGLIADGHGGAYTYTDVDGTTSVTLDPVSVSRTSVADVFEHAETGSRIQVVWDFVPTRVAANGVSDTGSQHLTVAAGVEVTGILFRGGTFGHGVYFTPRTGEYGQFFVRGRGIGRDIGAQGYVGVTRSLFGQSTNININPMLLRGGALQLGDNGRVDGLFVSFGPATTPGSITYTRTEPWSLLDLARQWWWGVYQHVQAQGDPFPGEW